MDLNNNETMISGIISKMLSQVRDATNELNGSINLVFTINILAKKEKEFLVIEHIDLIREKNE